MIAARPRPTVPEVGTAAPNVTVRDTTGTPVQLRDLWLSADLALVLVFLRQFG